MSSSTFFNAVLGQPCIRHMRKPKEARQRQKVSKGGLLPPLGGRINGLPGTLPPQISLPSPNMRLNAGSLVVGPDSTYVPENVLSPFLCPGAHAGSIPPWPLSNERESGCWSVIGCILASSHWPERGWAGSKTCTAPLGHLQPLEVDSWSHDMS